MTITMPIADLILLFAPLLTITLVSAFVVWLGGK